MLPIIRPRALTAVWVSRHVFWCQWLVFPVHHHLGSLHSLLLCLLQQEWAIAKDLVSLLVRLSQTGPPCSAGPSSQVRLSAPLARHVQGKNNIWRTLSVAPTWSFKNQNGHGSGACVVTLFKPQIDMFADMFSHWLLMYVSPVWVQVALVMEELATPWFSVLAYTFSPIPIKEKVLRKTRENRATLILVASILAGSVMVSQTATPDPDPGLSTSSIRVQSVLPFASKGSLLFRWSPSQGFCQGSIPCWSEKAQQGPILGSIWS